MSTTLRAYRVSFRCVVDGDRHLLLIVTVFILLPGLSSAYLIISFLDSD